MTEKVTSKEVIIGFVIGIVTNLAWALITENFNVYWIAAIFLGTIFAYYVGWKLIIQPLFTLKKSKVKAVYDSYNKAKPFLELISKIGSDKNNNTSQMNESEVTIIANQNATIVLQPSKQALHFPSFAITT